MGISAEKMYEKRLADVGARFRRDMDIELERVHATNIQQDRTLEARERAHQQRISVLEDTCQELREQASRSSRAQRRKQRQTAELLADIRRSTSPVRESN